MKYIFLLCACLISITSGLAAQERTVEFEIVMPDVKVTNSLYNTIRFIDSRDDPDYFGTLLLHERHGFLISTQSNLRQGDMYPSVVIVKVPLAVQFESLMRSLVDGNANNATLYFQLREFAFAETTAFAGNKGYFYFKAGIYARQGTNYKKLSTIDTIVTIKSTSLLNDLAVTASNVISRFVASNLLKVPSDSVSFTANEIAEIDNTEKSKIPIYYGSIWRDGLYATYNSFKNQIPDQWVIVEMHKEEISLIKRINNKGKEESVPAQDIYAVVYKGVPYIAIQNNYYKLFRKETDFFFITEGKLYISPVNIFVTTPVFFGLLSKIRQGRSYLMKIDHSSGGFKQIKEVERKEL